MEKKELLASWTYARGELFRQRVQKRLLVLGLAAGILLSGLVASPLFFGNTPLLHKASGGVIVLVLLLLAGIVLVLCRLLPGILFRLYKAFAIPAHEEIIITTEKIVSEKKTWPLCTAERVLTSVTYAAGRELIFRGREAKPGRGEKVFTVKLPVPESAQDQASAVLTHFRKRLQGEPSTG